MAAVHFDCLRLVGRLAAEAFELAQIETGIGRRIPREGAALRQEPGTVERMGVQELLQAVKVAPQAEAHFPLGGAQPEEV